MLSEDNLPPGIPPEALPHLREVGYFQDSPLQSGDRVPELSLYTPEGAAVALCAVYRDLPAVLVFGSFT